MKYKVGGRVKKLIFGNKQQETDVEIETRFCDFCGELKDCFCNMDNGKRECQWVLKDVEPSKFYECLAYGLFGLKCLWYYNEKKMKRYLRPKHVYFDKPQVHICQDCAKKMASYKLVKQ